MTEAERLRDEGIARVTAHNKLWFFVAHTLIDNLKEFYGTGEDLRVLLTSMGLPPPKHHNAWGALIRAARLKKSLLGTGRYVSMQTPKSHGRRSELLRKHPNPRGEP
jgi:hypothetical protein